MKVNFNETQKITQWWLWVFFMAITIIPIYGLYKQLIKGEPFGNNPMSNAGLLILALSVCALMITLCLIKLKTEINEIEIVWSFLPFLRKSVKWTEIKKAEVIQYGFVGGWGIRLFTKYGTVYNLKGNKGLAIELKNGKKLLIGTQRESELKEIIAKLTKDEKNRETEY